MTRRRTILAYLGTYVPDPAGGVELNELCAKTGVHYTTLYGYLHDPAPGSSYQRASTPSYRVLEDVGGWLARPRSKHIPHPVAVLACPHCGERKLLQPLKVPEVPGQLLCVACRRDRRTGWLYPDAYFEPWDGPQNTARRQGDQPIDGGLKRLGRSRIVVGSDRYEITVPSPYTPRQVSRRARQTGPDNGQA